MAKRHPLQMLTIQSSSGSKVVVYRGDTAPQMVGGYGGWEVVGRPKRTGLTQWIGKDPLRMKLPIIFDGSDQQISQESKITLLSRMALPTGPRGEPPRVSVLGAIPRKDLRWVIESLEWGDNVIWVTTSDTIGFRTRQDATLTLLEYVAEDRVGANRSTQNTRSPAAHTAVPDDTLRGIAARVYGDQARWADIASLNEIRDPKTIEAGQVLRLPR